MASRGSDVTLPAPLRVGRARSLRVEDPETTVSPSLPRLHAQCVGGFVARGRRVSGWGRMELEIDPNDALSVSLVLEGTHIVDRVFRFEDPVIDAVLAHFVPRERPSRSSHRRKDPRKGAVGQRSTDDCQLFVCVLSRPDFLSVYAPDGEAYEIPLPFQADRICALSPVLGGGLLLQRRPLASAPSAAAMAAAFSPSHAKTKVEAVSPTGQARYFSLRHPLEEVAPVALTPAPSTGSQRSASSTKQLQRTLHLSDPALDLVDVCVLPETLDEDEGGGDGTESRALLVCYHRHEWRFVVYDMSHYVDDPRLNQSDRDFNREGYFQVDSTHGVARSPASVFVSPAKERQQQREEAMSEQHYKSCIIPEWTTRLVWTTPGLDAVVDRSSKAFARGLTARHCQRAFIAHGVTEDDGRFDSYSTDEEAMFELWVVDERVGVVFVKPISALSPALTFRDREDDLRALRCHSAVPMTLDREAHQLVAGLATEVLISSSGSKRMFVHKAGHVVAEVLIPRFGSFHGLTPRQGAFAVAYRNASGRVEYRRYTHPFKIVSPLLSSVFDVIQYALSTRDYIKLLVATHGLATRYLAHRSSVDGTQWFAFRKVVNSTILRMIDSIGEVSLEHGASKKARPAESQEIVDFSTDPIGLVFGSEFAMMYNYQRSDVLATALSTTKPIMGDRDIGCESALDGVELSEKTLAHLITAFHLLHEDFRLSNGCSLAAVSLAHFLYDLSVKLGLVHLSAYYSRLYDGLQRRYPPLKQSSPIRLNVEISFEDYHGIPDVLLWLRERLQGFESDINSFKDEGSLGFAISPATLQAFPRLHGANDWKRYDWKQSSRIDTVSLHPLWRTEAVCRVGEILFPGDDNRPNSDGVTCYDTSRVTELMEYLTCDKTGSRIAFEDLPTGVRFVLMEAVRVCRENPPHDVSDRVAVFIGRRDLVSQYQEKREMGSSRSRSLYESTRLKSRTSSANGDAEVDSTSAREVSDGLSDVVIQCQPLFPNDQRLKEVARLLRSNRPVCLRLEKTSDMTDQAYIAQQQGRLFLLCTRSLALGVARGMVTLGAFDMSIVQQSAWKLDAPALPLTGRTPPTNATVQLDVSAHPKEMTHWPHFHNGCATGLRLPATDLLGIVTPFWIKYHRPSKSGSRHPRDTQQNVSSASSPVRDIEEAKASHAGMLLGLGLNGHLKCLTIPDVYRYLNNKPNEYVRIAIFLGMATAAARSRRKKAVFSSRALLSARRLRRSGVAGTAPDVATQDQGQFLTASQPYDGDENMDATQGAQADEEESKVQRIAPRVPDLSLERSVSKLLAIHIGLHFDDPFPHSARVAALLAFGILHQGTGKRAATEKLLAEITRSPASSNFTSQHHNSSGSTPSVTSSSAFERQEGYSLAAALGLGLVLLGRGGCSAGDPSLADIKLEEKLHKYIVGGAVQPVHSGGNESGLSNSCLYRGRKWDPYVSGLQGLNTRASGRGGNSYKHTGGDRSSWRGEQVNIGVTASGSALALSFMYLKSGNRSIASLLVVPDTLILLDYVRPDILLIRTLAKNLVMWDRIEPTASWIESSEIPKQLRDAYKVLQYRSGRVDESFPDFASLPDHADIRSICESYANIVAGACFSIGLRFAGTGDASARETLRRYVVHFRDMRSRSALLERGTIAAATERVTVERCLSVCAQSLALVEAGSGNLETLTLLRSINLRQRADSDLTYGNHMTLSMAIGLLFLGGGRATLSRSKDAIAALVISLYPISSMKPGDNTYYLEAFRHLYTQAVDFSRYVETIDVTSGEPCSLDLHVESRRDGPNGTALKTTSSFKTPCLLPEFDMIDRITINHPAFYPVDIRLGDDHDMDADDDDEDGWEDRTGYLNTPGAVANNNRVKVLLESSKILLERRPQAASISMASVSTLSTTQLGELTSARSGNAYLVDLLRDYFGKSFVSANQLLRGGDGGATAWWRQRLEEQSLRSLSASLLPARLNVLFEVFSMHHPRRQLTSLVGVWNLKLILEFQRMDPFYSLEHSSSSAFAKKDAAIVDFVDWLHSQVEEGLRQRWRNEASVSFSSLSEIREVLLEQYNDEDVERQPLFPPSLTSDSVLLAAFFAFFDAPPTVYGDSADWKRRMLHAVVTATSSTRSKGKFAIDRFLSLRSHGQVSKEEQAFWLRVVSCFLFSV